MFRTGTGSPFPTGSNPVSNATADLDGDGDLDLLTANYISDNVSVLLNNGAGAFVAGTAVPVGNGPREVEAGDLDGDGDIDFLVTNYSGDSVSVLRNNGNATFTAAPVVLVGDVPRGLGIGDLDGDGDLDFVSVNYGSDNVSVRLNNGSAGFAAAGAPVTTGTNPVAVALGDFDGDSDVDMAVTNNSNSNVSILLNNGSAGFTATTPAGTGLGPRGIATGDFDGDGDLDLAVANFGANSLSILLNNGSAGFTPATGSPLSTGNNPYAVTVGDLDGDGDVDIAVTNSGSSSVSVFRNNGSASFTPAAGSPFGVGVSPGGVVMGDFDKDGDLDLSTANFGSNTASVLINTAAFYSVTSNVRTIEGTPPGAGGALVFTIHRSATSEAENVTYALGGSATAGADYVGSGGIASFAVGQATVVILIPVAADKVIELDETVVLTLSGASGDGVINPAASSATGKIIGDDPVVIRGTKGKDVVDATHTVKKQPFPTEGFDKIVGRSGNDRLSGLGGDDKLLGGKGKDVLRGDDGNDRLAGGTGKNKLFGGAGDDTFVFDAKIGNGGKSKSYAKIADFAEGDVLELAQSKFKKLDAGAISDTVFRDIGEKATKESHISYKANGNLSYDKDGKGGADAIVFAKLLNRPDIDAGDLIVV